MGKKGLVLKIIAFEIVSANPQYYKEKTCQRQSVF